MNRSRICCLPAVVLASALLATAGCTHTAKIKVVPTQLPAAQAKLPGRAALVLDEEFNSFQYQFKMMGDTFVYPVGPSLNQYARNVVEHAYSRITVVPTAEAAVGHADAILVPKALKADQSHGVWAWDDRRFSLIVEWTLKDGQNRNVLWVKPIEGKATETGGNLFTGKSHERKLFQKLFDHLSLKTYEALTHSSGTQNLSARP